MNLSFEAWNDSFPEMSSEVYWIKKYAILFYYDSVIPALWEIKNIWQLFGSSRIIAFATETSKVLIIIWTNLIRIVQ